MNPRNEFLNLFPSRNKSGQVAGTFTVIWYWVDQKIKEAHNAGVAEERERWKSGSGMVDPNLKEQPHRPETKEAATDEDS